MEPNLDARVEGDRAYELRADAFDDGFEVQVSGVNGKRVASIDVDGGSPPQPTPSTVAAELNTLRGVMEMSPMFIVEVYVGGYAPSDVVEAISWANRQSFAHGRCFCSASVGCAAMTKGDTMAATRNGLVMVKEDCHAGYGGGSANIFKPPAGHMVTGTPETWPSSGVRSKSCRRSISSKRL